MSFCVQILKHRVLCEVQKVLLRDLFSREVTTFKIFQDILKDFKKFAPFYESLIIND